MLHVCDNCRTPLGFLVLCRPAVSTTFCTNVWFRAPKLPNRVRSRMGLSTAKCVGSGELGRVKLGFSPYL